MRDITSRLRALERSLADLGPTARCPGCGRSPLDHPRTAVLFEEHGGEAGQCGNCEGMLDPDGKPVATVITIGPSYVAPPAPLPFEG